MHIFFFVTSTQQLFEEEQLQQVSASGKVLFHVILILHTFNS